MNTRLRKLTCIGIAGFILSGLCWGCAGVEKKFDEWQTAIREKMDLDKSDQRDAAGQDGQEKYFIHTTRWSWETMAYVAEWYTGDAGNAVKLVDLNPYVKPEKIAVGSEVVIPVSLLTTREPLPKNFTGEHREDYYRHTVRWPGESLSLIASWYTGSHRNWRKLARANPQLNPNRIKKGNVIRIPQSLLKTRAALPQKVAAKFTAQYFAYTVKADDEKLEDIARWYTGNSANRDRLAKANPDLNPDHLTPGNEVYIPQNLLKTRQPVNVKAAEPATAPSTPVANVPPSEPKTALTEDEDIKLFGPKQFPKH